MNKFCEYLLAAGFVLSIGSQLIDIKGAKAIGQAVDHVRLAHPGVHAFQDASR